MANYAQTVNVIGAIKTTKTAAELETTGLVLKLYRERFGVTPVEVGADLRPLDVSAALSADGRALTLAVVNPTEETRRLRLQVAGGRALSGSGQKWVITGKDRWAHNRPGAPRQVDITRGSGDPGRGQPLEAGSAERDPVLALAEVASCPRPPDATSWARPPRRRPRSASPRSPSRPERARRHPGRGREAPRRRAWQRLQEWVKQPSIAAENRGMAEGCELMMRLAREAGFQSVTRVPTDGQPGVFATLDAGAPRTVGLYFMYDVKQVDPGRVVVAAVGRGARRQARLRQGADGPRRREPEGAAGRVPGRPARDPRRREEAAREPRPGRGGRGGDRLAALPPGGAAARGERRPQALRRASSCPRPPRIRTAP